MSVQTNLSQYFKIKYKCTQNINSKSEDFNLKGDKTLVKKPKYRKSKEKYEKDRRKKTYPLIQPSSYCDVIYKAESTCHVNEPVNNIQIANTSAQSTLGIIEICISDDEENIKVDVLPDYSITYESALNNKISIDKKNVIEYEQHAKTTTCTESQSKSVKRKESPCYNDNDSKKVPKIDLELFTKEANQNHMIEEDSKIFNTQYETMTNQRSVFSSPCNTPIKNTLNSSFKQTTTFTPRKSSMEKTGLSNMKNKNNSNLFFRTIVDKRLTATALEYLNLVQEGAIQANNFDLKAIYTNSNSFRFTYNRVDTAAPMKYEIQDVVIPTETNAAHLFMIIVNVFSNPINCGYFDKGETDFIFSMLTLSIKAQMLLARVLKRKHLWHRVENLKQKYNIADDLIQICEELVSKSFFTSDIEKEELTTFFKMLQVDEVRKICHKLNLKVTNNKEKLVQSLLKVAAKKPLFSGMKSPRDKLKSLILNELGYCINVTQKTLDIFDKILTLLIPNQDPQETLSDTYHMLVQVEIGKISFPKFSNERYPIFSNKKQLMEYIEAKHELTNILNAIDNKQWDNVRKIGKLAYSKWLDISDIESTSLEDSMLPLHIRHFMPGYLWLKVLSKSIDAFKKVNHTLPFATELLYTLIKQNCHMQSKKGMWCAELALIEMYHNKDLEASASVILESLKLETLSEIGMAELFERAKKLVKRKKLTRTTLMNIQAVIKSMENSFSFVPPKSTIAEAVLIKGNNGMGNKSKWCINNSIDSKSYSSVEYVALDYYHRQGFNGGVHCEGALPVTLFFTLFWEELYNINVPGSFVTLYQGVPLDLFTQDFYKNRKLAIEKKLKNIRNLDPESLSSEMQNKFISYSQFESMIHTKLFTSSDIRDIVYSLGTEGVVSICERLIHNYTLWKAGFPDLIVWNSNNKSCKIVEVKGPGDKLSIKQTLWLQFLHQLGLDVEVCLVKDNRHEEFKKSLQ